MINDDRKSASACTSEITIKIDLISIKLSNRMQEGLTELLETVFFYFQTNKKRNIED